MDLSNFLQNSSFPKGGAAGVQAGVSNNNKPFKQNNRNNNVNNSNNQAGNNPRPKKSFINNNTATFNAPQQQQNVVNTFPTSGRKSRAGGNFQVDNSNNPSFTSKPARQKFNKNFNDNNHPNANNASNNNFNNQFNGANNQPFNNPQGNQQRRGKGQNRSNKQSVDFDSNFSNNNNNNNQQQQQQQQQQPFNKRNKFNKFQQNQQNPPSQQNAANFPANKQLQVPGQSQQPKGRNKNFNQVAAQSAYHFTNQAANNQAQQQQPNRFSKGSHKGFPNPKQNQAAIPNQHLLQQLQQQFSNQNTDKQQAQRVGRFQIKKNPQNFVDAGAFASAFNQIAKTSQQNVEENEEMNEAEEEQPEDELNDAGEHAAAEEENLEGDEEVAEESEHLAEDDGDNLDDNEEEVDEAAEEEEELGEGEEGLEDEEEDDLLEEEEELDEDNLEDQNDLDQEVDHDERDEEEAGVDEDEEAEIARLETARIAQRAARFTVAQVNPTLSAAAASVLPSSSINTIVKMSAVGEEVEDEEYNELVNENQRIVGRCMDMCPLRERLDRQEARTLSAFEIIPGTGSKAVGDVPLVDHSKAVKKYKRAAASQKLNPDDVRPPDILVKTNNYLMNDIVDRTDQPFYEVYRFVSDRMRSFRQDFVCQSIKDTRAITVYEQMARFHIISFAELLEEPRETFDPIQNYEKLSQTLTSLRHYYRDNSANYQTVRYFPTPNEAEMQSYYLFIHFSKNFLQTYNQTKESLKTDPLIQFALQVYSAYRDGEYATFFKLFRQANYYHACLMLFHINSVRMKALQVISNCYLQYPLAQFTQSLAFDNTQQVLQFLNYHSIKLSPPNSPDIIFKSNKLKQTFVQPAQPIAPQRPHKLLSSKKPRSIKSACVNAADASRYEKLFRSDRKASNLSLSSPLSNSTPAELNQATRSRLQDKLASLRQTLHQQHQPAEANNFPASKAATEEFPPAFSELDSNEFSAPIRLKRKTKPTAAEESTTSSFVPIPSQSNFSLEQPTTDASAGFSFNLPAQSGSSSSFISSFTFPSSVNESTTFAHFDNSSAAPLPVTNITTFNTPSLSRSLSARSKLNAEAKEFLPSTSTFTFPAPAADIMAPPSVQSSFNQQPTGQFFSSMNTDRLYDNDSQAGSAAAAVQPEKQPALVSIPSITPVNSQDSKQKRPASAAQRRPQRFTDKQIKRHVAQFLLRKSLSNWRSYTEQRAAEKQRIFELEEMAENYRYNSLKIKYFLQWYNVLLHADQVRRDAVRQRQILSQANFDYSAIPSGILNSTVRASKLFNSSDVSLRIIPLVEEKHVELINEVNMIEGSEPQASTNTVQPISYEEFEQYHIDYSNSAPATVDYISLIANSLQAQNPRYSQLFFNLLLDFPTSTVISPANFNDRNMNPAAISQHTAAWQLLKNLNLIKPSAEDFPLDNNGNYSTEDAPIMSAFSYELQESYELSVLFRVNNSSMGKGGFRGYQGSIMLLEYAFDVEDIQLEASYDQYNQPNFPPAVQTLLKERFANDAVRVTNLAYKLHKNSNIPLLVLYSVQPRLLRFFNELYSPHTNTNNTLQHYYSLLIAQVAFGLNLYSLFPQAQFHSRISGIQIEPFINFDQQSLQQPFDWLLSNSPRYPEFHQVSISSALETVWKQQSNLIQSAISSEEINPSNWDAQLLLDQFNSASRALKKRLNQRALKDISWPPINANLKNSSKNPHSMAIPPANWNNNSIVHNLRSLLDNLQLPPLASTQTLFNAASYQISANQFQTLIFTYLAQWPTSLENNKSNGNTNPNFSNLLNSVNSILRTAAKDDMLPVQVGSAIMQLLINYRLHEFRFHPLLIQYDENAILSLVSTAELSKVRPISLQLSDYYNDEYENEANSLPSSAKRKRSDSVVDNNAKTTTQSHNNAINHHASPPSQQSLISLAHHEISGYSSLNAKLDELERLINSSLKKKSRR
jgi:hypothetical protein